MNEITQKNVLFVDNDMVYCDLVDHYTNVILNKNIVQIAVQYGEQLIGKGRIVPDLTQMNPTELANLWGDLNLAEKYAQGTTIDLVVCQTDDCNLVVAWDFLNLTPEERVAIRSAA